MQSGTVTAVCWGWLISAPPMDHRIIVARHSTSRSDMAVCYIRHACQRDRRHAVALQTSPFSVEKGSNTRVGQGQPGRAPMHLNPMHEMFAALSNMSARSKLCRLSCCTYRCLTSAANGTLRAQHPWTITCKQYIAIPL